MKPRKRLDATTELAIACGAVARNMQSPCARSLAAGRAVSIGPTWHELHRSRYADLVRYARTFLRNLPVCAPETLDLMARDARNFSTALYEAAEFSRQRKRLIADLRESGEGEVA